MNVPKGFTTGASKVLIQAQIGSASLGHEKMGTGHIVMGLCRTGDELSRCVLGDLTYEQIQQAVIEQYGRGIVGFSKITGLTAHAQRVLLRALAYANPEKKTMAGIAHIWQELLYEEGCTGLEVLVSLGKTIEGMKLALVNAVGEVERPLSAISIAASSEPISREEVIAVQRAEEKQNQASDKQEKENILDVYARNLTQAAREGKLEPLIGRQHEIDSMIRVLGKKMKNNPMLIGEPGVGKSALVEGLAQCIVNGSVPPDLKEAQIYALDMAQLIAGSKFRGEFEERIKKILNSIVQMKNVVLFIDEIHTIIGAGSSSEGSLDAANILKPALARGEIRVIGATTYKEYQKHVEKDAALARRFQRIDVREPDRAQTLEILKGLRERYENYHRVTISDAALEAAVDLSARYVSDRYMPDKAIDLIDETASMAKIEGWQHIRTQDENEIVDLNDPVLSGIVIGPREIARVVSQWTGVPVDRVGSDEKEILQLEKHLLQRIIGQKEAVSAISKALRRSRAGLNDPARPLGVFMLLGPSGVGKTELCKALSEAMFGSEEALIRIDMSEYAEEASASRLIGSPPGYVGHGEGGQLTDAVLKRPYSVVLFDEIEKAHPKIFSLLLQLLDDGRLTDSVGRKVNFKNTIIVMTSNSGVSFDMDKRLGFASDSRCDDRKRLILSQVKQTFRPEFLGRIDEMIVMNSLTAEDGRHIAELLLGKTVKRMAQQGIMLEYDDDVPALLASEGLDPMSGARNLRRVIVRRVEEPLSDMILSGQISGNLILLKAAQDEIQLIIPQETLII